MTLFCFYFRTIEAAACSCISAALLARSSKDVPHIVFVSWCQLICLYKEVNRIVVARSGPFRCDSSLIVFSFF
jgi:hypothetical protein